MLVYMMKQLTYVREHMSTACSGKLAPGKLLNIVTWLFSLIWVLRGPGKLPSVTAVNGLENSKLDAERVR